MDDLPFDMGIAALCFLLCRAVQATGAEPRSADPPPGCLLPVCRALNPRSLPGPEEKARLLQDLARQGGRRLLALQGETTCLLLRRRETKPSVRRSSPNPAPWRSQPAHKTFMGLRDWQRRAPSLGVDGECCAGGKVLQNGFPGQGYSRLG